MRTLTSLACAAALTLALAPGARADENDRLTYMTFSGPVQVPGATLPAGTYTFKLADGASSRHVVQIFNKDDNRLITTVMTIPNERRDPVQDTFVMFQERPAGTPMAVKAWFYPGRSIGEEFMYPRNQAMAIARSANDSVLTTDGETVTSTGKAGRVDSTGTFSDVTETTSTATTTTASTATTTTAPSATTTTTTTTTAPRATATANAGVNAPTMTAQDRSVTAPAADARVAVGTAGQAAEAAPAPRRRLPQTASPIAMMTLLSGLSLAGAYGLRRLRK